MTLRYVFINFEKIRDNEITQAFIRGKSPHVKEHPIKIELSFLKVTLESSRKWSNVLKCEEKKISKLKF